MKAEADMTDQVLAFVRQYRALVREQAERSLSMERSLAQHEIASATIEELEPQLRQRQRDYAALIRVTYILEQRYAEGNPWKAVRRRLIAMNRRLDRRYEILGQEIAALADQPLNPTA